MRTVHLFLRLLKHTASGTEFKLGVTVQPEADSDWLVGCNLKVVQVRLQVVSKAAWRAMYDLTRILTRTRLSLLFRFLGLSGLQLGGQAPTFLGQLKALVYVPAAPSLAYLRLRPLVGNGFHHSEDDACCNTMLDASLRGLQLGNSGFKPEGTIPAGIYKLPKLTFLDVRNNEFHDAPIPNAIMIPGKCKCKCK